MTQPPALVIVTSSFPISGDGSEAAGAFVADLAEEFAKHMPVRVVAPGRSNRRELWGGGIEVLRYATPAQPLSTLRLWHPADAKQVLQVLRAGQRVTDQAIAVGPTAHVLALWALPCGYWARRSAHRHGINYSVWTLGSDVWNLRRIPLVRSLLRLVLRDAEHCMSDGFKLRDDTEAIAGRPVEFLPSARRIDRPRIEPVRSRPPYRLLFLGRWHPNKGIDLLLESLDLLSGHEWSLIECVTIAGGGPLTPDVVAAVQRLEAASRPVELRSYLNREEAQDAMLASDYLLIPSRIESIPVVMSDAFKLRCPVICTPVGDMGEFVSRYRVGIVAEGVSASAIRGAISTAVLGDQSFEEAALDAAAEVFNTRRIAGRIFQFVGSDRA